MLYGDGVHDDTEALQALVDQGACVHFAMPDVRYLISAPLVLRSGQSLVLDRYCHVQLMPGSDCVMLTNADHDNGDRNIEVTGGIWDLNNLAQSKNPFHFSESPEMLTGQHHPEVYDGTVLSFSNVSYLRIAHLTIKDPVTFSIPLNRVEHFTVEDITFDFNYGNPWAVNMDGVHLCGNCRFGVIRNLKGACYDDMVALNADEGTPGPISDIQVDGLFAEDCHSAVRLLSANHPVERVTISNVFGSYYQYCIGVTKYYEGDDGYFDSIVIRDVFAAKATRHTIYHKDGTKVYPFIWVQGGLRVKNLQVSNIYRKESRVAVEAVGIDRGTVVENLSIEHLVQENLLAEPVPLIVNRGVIERLQARDLRNSNGSLVDNEGTIVSAG